MTSCLSKILSQLIAHARWHLAISAVFELFCNLLKPVRMTKFIILRPCTISL